MLCLGSVLVAAILQPHIAPSPRPRFATPSCSRSNAVVASLRSATSTAAAHHTISHDAPGVASARAWRKDVDHLRTLEASGHVASVIEYSAAMNACREAGEWRCCELLLQRARQRSITPLVDLYAIAIGACDDAGQPEDGVRLYEQGVEEGTFSHWHAEEPFSLDLHGFSQPCAASAVRYVLQRELANYIPSDLKIITGRGSHSADGVSRLLPRIEKLLSKELEPPLPYEHASHLVCDEGGCQTIRNKGCLVVEVHELFKWLVDSRPCESYYLSIPATTA